MPETDGSPTVAVIDGTARECTGVIAALEHAMRGLAEGATVQALVTDVPSRIDVHAWAERKGHTIPEERREPGRFRITILKGGRRPPGRVHDAPAVDRSYRSVTASPEFARTR